MYINTITFTDGAKLHQEGEVNEAPSQELIDAGLVRETKVQEAPKETKTVKAAETKKAKG